jgi:iron complex outermembrane receptor protein
VSDQDTQAARVQAGWFPSSLPLDGAVQRSTDTRDHSGMRGFQRLAPNRFVPGDVPMSSRYDIKSGMPNQNHTDSSGHALTANWRLGGDWALKYIYSHRESDTDTAIDFDGLPNKIADVLRHLHRRTRDSHELQLVQRRRRRDRHLPLRAATPAASVLQQLLQPHLWRHARPASTPPAMRCSATTTGS